MIYDALRPLNPVDVRRPGYKGLTFRPAYTTVHHTAAGGAADVPSLNVCLFGRSDLPGPLCHVLIGRSGSVYCITDGYANHAGRCFEPYSNYNTVGVEIENNGVGEPYSAAAMHSAREVCRLLGLPVIGHKEICSPVGRKIDPSFDMDAFRASLLQEEEVLAPDERNAVLNVNHWVINTLEDPNGQPIDLYGMLLGLSSQVAALQIGGGAVDIDALAEAVADKLAARLAN